MILIVLLVLILFGVSPFGLGHAPGDPDCAGSVDAPAAPPDGCGDLGRRDAWQATPTLAGGCDDPGLSLLMRRGSATVLVDPRTHDVRELPVNPGVVRAAERSERLLTRIVPGEWHVVRTPDEQGQRIVVYERQSGETVFDESFTRRIELSTVAVSPTGGVTIHVQANNVASEITVLDARVGAVRQLDIDHDARLAAFAIDVAISPDETCAAISMERVDGNGPETWLLDLEAGHVRSLPVLDVFVLGWTCYQV